MFVLKHVLTTKGKIKHKEVAWDTYLQNQVSGGSGGALVGFLAYKIIGGIGIAMMGTAFGIGLPVFLTVGGIAGAGFALFKTQKANNTNLKLLILIKLKISQNSFQLEKFINFTDCNNSIIVLL